MNDIRMDLTCVVPTDRNMQEYIVLSRGTVTAIINTEYKDVIISDHASKEGSDYTISGRGCKSASHG